MNKGDIAPPVVNEHADGTEILLDANDTEGLARVLGALGARDDNGGVPVTPAELFAHLNGPAPRRLSTMKTATGATVMLKMRICGHCNAGYGGKPPPPGGLKKCAGCHAVSYCNAKCQRADRRRHKTECDQLAAEHTAAKAEVAAARAATASELAAVKDAAATNIL